MQKSCRTGCSTVLEGPKCGGQMRFPHTPCEAKKLNFGEEKETRQLQCSSYVRRCRAEARRQKIIRRLKCVYRINVDELSKGIVDEMVIKVEVMEKEKRAREKLKQEGRVNFMRKLVREEKFKRRGMGPLPVVRKKLSDVKRPLAPVAERPASEDVLPEDERDLPLPLTIDYPSERSDAGEAEVRSLNVDDLTERKESEPGPPKSAPCSPRERDPEPEVLREVQRPAVTDRREAMGRAPEERHMTCTPSFILFENCEPNTTYVQTFRISNVGFDVVHCRYAGIEVKDDTGGGVPIRVDATENALLRPGLSFSTKVRLFSQVETSELHYALLFQTRRKKYPNRHACFRVPVTILPARSIVEVSPTVLRFPVVTWCVATGPERSKHLTRAIRIRNTGARGCSCAIWRRGAVEERSEGSEPTPGEGSVEGAAAESSGEELPGEVDLLEGYEDAAAIIAELVDNVFDVFRFSRKYFIPVPAMSTVKVDVDFQPQYKGYHHEVVYVRFEGSHDCSEEKVELIGEIKKVPLRTEPTAIDLKICVVNSGVYGGTFKVYNDSGGSFPVRLKVPGSMKEHCSVFPRSPVIQPYSYQTCSVRLFPRATISADAYRYYQEDTKVLEFPVFIQPSGPNACQLDKIKIYVFAMLTDYSLELNPPDINFGTINTLETVRAEVTLTNHSMAPQEYGFLNLPMGVRIEPNNGFGVILPKETVPLYLLYSPVEQECEGPYEFLVRVTSVAELGGFGERPTPAAETGASDLNWGEYLKYNTEVGSSTVDEPSQCESDPSWGEEEEEESFVDPAEESRVLEDKERRIRDYLTQGPSQEVLSAEGDSIREEPEYSGEWEAPPRDTLSVIACKAHVIVPRCEFSATAIQLPATPLSSSSVTRFRLNATRSRGCPGDGLTCEAAGRAKTEPFEAAFQFTTTSPLVTLEPSCGHIVEGQSVPIAVIFRPEFSKEELKYQSRILKAEMMYEEETKSREEVSPVGKAKSKTKAGKPARQVSRHKKMDVETWDVNLLGLDITKYDLFAGERALQQMIDPFHLVVRVTCTVRMLPAHGDLVRVEEHRLNLIAPVVKPSFTYLGRCQEIRFGKVAVGDHVRKVLEIQNISLNRIAPRVSALNPHGPFICTTGWKMDKIDPEHIWRHPITFAPTGERGKETEFLDIRHGLTSITLAVHGEGVSPKCAFTPDFTLCVIQGASEAISDVEFYVENQCEAELRLEFVRGFVRSSSSFRHEAATGPDAAPAKSDASVRKTERDRRTSQTRDARRRTSFRADVTPDVASQLDEFTPVQNPPPDLFTIVGLDLNNEVVLYPFTRALLKIRFWSHDTDSTRENGNKPNLTIAFFRFENRMG